MQDEAEEPRREIDLCMTCSHFEHEEETPHCRKFRAWPEEVVEECGGPY